MQGIFATAINCMDGRVQKPVFNFICANYGVDFIDMITEPGPIKILSENHDKFTIESLRLKTALSIDKHKSNLIAIIGHHDCAGNPVHACSYREWGSGKRRPISFRVVPCAHGGRSRRTPPASVAYYNNANNGSVIFWNINNYNQTHPLPRRP